MSTKSDMYNPKTENDPDLPAKFNLAPAFGASQGSSAPHKKAGEGTDYPASAHKDTRDLTNSVSEPVLAVPQVLLDQNLGETAGMIEEFQDEGLAHSVQPPTQNSEPSRKLPMIPQRQPDHQVTADLDLKPAQEWHVNNGSGEQYANFPQSSGPATFSEDSEKFLRHNQGPMIREDLMVVENPHSQINKIQNHDDLNRNKSLADLESDLINEWSSSDEFNAGNDKHISEKRSQKSNKKKSQKKKNEELTEINDISDDFNDLLSTGLQFISKGLNLLNDILAARENRSSFSKALMLIESQSIREEASMSNESVSNVPSAFDFSGNQHQIRENPVKSLSKTLESLYGSLYACVSNLKEQFDYKELNSNCDGLLLLEDDCEKRVSRFVRSWSSNESPQESLFFDNTNAFANHQIIESKGIYFPETPFETPFGMEHSDNDFGHEIPTYPSYFAYPTNVTKAHRTNHVPNAEKRTQGLTVSQSQSPFQHKPLKQDKMLNKTSEKIEKEMEIGGSTQKKHCSERSKSGFNETNPLQGDCENRGQSDQEKLTEKELANATKTLASNIIKKLTNTINDVIMRDDGPDFIKMTLIQEMKTEGEKQEFRDFLYKIRGLSNASFCKLKDIFDEEKKNKKVKSKNTLKTIMNDYLWSESGEAHFKSYLETNNFGAKNAQNCKDKHVISRVKESIWKFFKDI